MLASRQYSSSTASSSAAPILSHWAKQIDLHHRRLRTGCCPGHDHISLGHFRLLLQP